MREFTKVSPALHNSEKFRSLGRDYAAKCVYQYLLSCPHGNSSGCFDLKPGYACEDLDMDTEQYRNHIETLCKVHLIEVEPGKNTVFIVNWLTHNGAANPKHATGMLTQLKLASSDALFCKRYDELVAKIKEKKFDKEQSVRASMETLSQRYRDCITTKTETKTKTTDQDVDQTETRPDLDLREVTQTALRSGPEEAERAPSAVKGSMAHLLETPLMKSIPSGVTEPVPEFLQRTKVVAA